MTDQALDEIDAIDFARPCRLPGETERVSWKDYCEMFDRGLDFALSHPRCR